MKVILKGSPTDIAREMREFLGQDEPTTHYEESLPPAYTLTLGDTKMEDRLKTDLPKKIVDEFNDRPHPLEKMLDAEGPKMGNDRPTSSEPSREDAASEPQETFACQFCAKPCVRRARKMHERFCKANPNRVESPLEKKHRQKIEAKAAADARDRAGGGLSEDALDYAESMTDLGFDGEAVRTEDF